MGMNSVSQWHLLPLTGIIHFHAGFTTFSPLCQLICISHCQSNYTVWNSFFRLSYLKLHHRKDHDCCIDIINTFRQLTTFPEIVIISEARKAEIYCQSQGYLCTISGEPFNLYGDELHQMKVKNMKSKNLSIKVCDS